MCKLEVIFSEPVAGFEIFKEAETVLGIHVITRYLLMKFNQVETNYSLPRWAVQFSYQFCYITARLIK